MKTIVLLVSLLILQKLSGQENLYSPDRTIRVSFKVDSVIRFAVDVDGKELIAPSAVALQIDGKVYPKNVISNIKRNSVKQDIINPIPERRKIIIDHYNSISFKINPVSGLEFRAYNDGISYRWVTFFKDSIRIKDEFFELDLSDSKVPIIFQETEVRAGVDKFHTSFEDIYQRKPVDSISKESFLYTPYLVSPDSGPKILVTESDLEDYPGIFFHGSHNQILHADFAGYPNSEKVNEGEFPQAVVTGRENFIAETKGSRTFPWRVMIIARKDTVLASSDMVYRLASPSRVPDVSWIHPGQGTDEWIIGISLFNVPFKAGINTATYKYYIDFAKKFGLERIMLDAGWSDTKDLFNINPGLNMDELAAYAKQQGIKLSMWTLALTLDRQLDSALEQFSRWGVDFIMTDFMDRDDQKMVQFYHRVAKACADKKIMVMFHGAFKTAGFNRTWPNAVTREGVLGSEYNIWSEKPTPDHNVTLPFIRMAAGPMDYEPGLLDNATKQTFRPISGKVMSQGTRCHQLAMFLVYESVIQIFSGNPSQGLMEPEFMELLGSIPTSWDETIVLDGSVSKYIVTARKNGNEWFLGAMSGWEAPPLKKYPLNFLEEGEYEVTICQDGINANQNAMDYTMLKKRVRRTDMLEIEMKNGGGFLARFRKSGN
ncbi:glycoside hydrolase family 97 protein [Pollutibacter soli]|uniref:glycoside hydrolase family 97 protein n=1 Tax=Pollutibacter soli TaxID=3034157 RepID=UPI0030132623